jgi:hypothetical protein
MPEEDVVTEILRGQQGHPTPEGREAGPLAEVDPSVSLPRRDDWERPEEAEEVANEARSSLGQVNDSDRHATATADLET